MNYWLLTSEYPPFFGGGIGTYCSITARMMADHGHRVSVFIPDASVSDVQITESANVRVIRFGTSRTDSSSFLGHTTNISYEFAHVVKEFIEKEGKPDCIEAQEYLGIAYYLLQYKKLLYDWCQQVPVIITMHSPSFLYMEYNQVPVYRYPNYWICEMERFCLQAADHIISPSRFMLRELDKRFELLNKNVTVIPNPFDGVSYKIVPQTVKHSGEIVFYGKLTAQKGAFKLMQYFQQLWDDGFDQPLYLLGGQDIVYHPEGIAMGDIIRKKYKVYLDKGLLRMENRIPPQEVAARLEKAEVVIIPSNNDNLPYVAFEMMALGKTVLVSQQGGHSEVVEDGIDGFIFDHEQPVTFGQQLKSILGLNEAQQKRISEHAIKKVAEGYNPELIYQKKIAVLNTVIAQANAERKIFPFIRRPMQEVATTKTEGVQGKLSVVIPYYNMGAYIEETIRSVQASNYADKEIVLVNDGSTDTLSISKLEQYRKTKGIIVLDFPNGGLGKARNLGAEHASGEYLAFLDADDRVHPEYYTRSVKVLSRYDNVHFVGSWISYFGNSKNTWPSFQPEPPLILYHNLVNSSSLVYRRNAYISAGKNNEAMAFPGLEDYDSVISMLEKGCGGVVLPEKMFHYRVRSDSMFRAVSRAKKLYLYQQITATHKQFYANFAADTFNLQNANGPGIFMDNPSLDYHLADKLPFGGKMANKAIALIKRNGFAKTIAYKLYRLLKK